MSSKKASPTNADLDMIMREPGGVKKKAPEVLGVCII